LVERVSCGAAGRSGHGNRSGGRGRFAVGGRSAEFRMQGGGGVVQRERRAVEGEIGSVGRKG